MVYIGNDCNNNRLICDFIIDNNRTNDDIKVNCDDISGFNRILSQPVLRKLTSTVPSGQKAVVNDKQVQLVSAVNGDKRRFIAASCRKISAPSEAPVAPTAAPGTSLVARHRHSDGAQISSPSSGLLHRHDSQAARPSAVGHLRTSSSTHYGLWVSMHCKYQQQRYHHRNHRQVDYDRSSIIGCGDDGYNSIAFVKVCRVVIAITISYQ